MCIFVTDCWQKHIWPCETKQAKMMMLFTVTLKDGDVTKAINIKLFWQVNKTSFQTL